MGVTGGDPAAGYTGANVTGFVIGGNYTSNLTAKYATAPPVDCSGATSVILQFRRWLGLRSSDTASIQVSVNGTTWTDVWKTTATVADTSWQLLQYDISAVAAGQSAVRVRWGLASNNRNNSYGWNLDDVEVLGNGAPVDTEAPAAALSALAVTTAGGPVYEFNVTYSDNRAVAVAGIDDLDIYVLGPNAYSNDCSRTGLNETTDGTPRVATYQCPAAGGSWDPADNGAYQVFLRDGEVLDTSNNPAPGGLLGGFAVSIPTPNRQLTVSVTPAGWGTVDPPGGTYPEGSQVSVTAIPGTYYEFDRWQGGSTSTNNPVTVTMNGDVALQAVMKEALTSNTGTPLAWLALHGYTNDFETAALQTGANGMPVWQSYVAGLNPADPGDDLRLHLGSVGGAGGNVLDWDPVEGRLYTLRHSSSLTGPYLPLTGAVRLPWTFSSFTDSVEHAEFSAYYELEVELP